MKLITIFGKTFKPVKQGRKLIADCIERAMRNSAKPGFNAKYFHPRSLRVSPSQKP